jgi:hypothetical protein
MVSHSKLPKQPSTSPTKKTSPTFFGVRAVNSQSQPEVPVETDFSEVSDSEDAPAGLVGVLHLDAIADPASRNVKIPQDVMDAMPSRLTHNGKHYTRKQVPRLSSCGKFWSAYYNCKHYRKL